MSNENLDRLFKNIFEQCSYGKIATLKFARYLFNNKGKGINGLASQCSEDGFSQHVITAFVKLLQDQIGDSIEQEGKDLQYSKQAVLELASKRNITFKKYQYDPQYADWFKGTALNFKRKGHDMKGIPRIKECLKWINCLTEFYCEEPLFIEKLSDNCQNNNLEHKKIKQENIATDKENEVIYNLWKKGYLQCSLDK